jgi:tetratricopeptide (TPR) repeat protein
MKKVTRGKVSFFIEQTFLVLLLRNQYKANTCSGIPKITVCLKYSYAYSNKKDSGRTMRCGNFARNFNSRSTFINEQKYSILCLNVISKGLKSMSTPYEVFFSYAHEDEDWRKKIEKYLYALERQNYIQGWHDRNILAGSEWEREIMTRLNTAPIILLLVSQDFLASDFCWGVELQQAMQRHDAGTARVIPIIVRPCTWQNEAFAKLQFLPDDGKPLSTWPDEDEALLQIENGIRRVVEQMREHPQVTTATETQEQPAGAIAQQPWNVPLLRNPFFTGRAALLTRLRTSLTQTHTTALSQPQAISGLGGIGKTQIAVEYAYRHRNDYQAILWVKASTPEELTEDVAALARILNLPEQRASKQQESIDAVQHWLATHDGWLLIFDNADNLSLLTDYLPSAPKGHIVLTTRAHALGGMARKLEVPQMDEAEGVRLLLYRAGLMEQQTTTGELPAEIYQQATAIFHLLGGLPLALDQAGAYIEETQESLLHYPTVYQTKRKALLERRGGIRSDHLPVATTWNLAFQTIEQSNPAAIELMRLCSFLSPDAIPEKMILASTEYLTPLLQSITQERTRWNNALADLLKYSLIRRNQATMSLSIHRLLQAVIKDEMDAQQQETWEACVVRLTDSVFPFDEVAPWVQSQEYLPHALLATEYIASRTMTFFEAGGLLNNVGTYFYYRGQYIQAEALYQRSLKIFEQVLGPEHPDTATTLNNQANLYAEQGKYEEAGRLYQRSLKIREQVSGPEHPDTATTLNNLALLYAEQGKYEEAEALCQRSLKIFEQVLGPEHPDTAQTLNNQGRPLFRSGEI